MIDLMQQAADLFGIHISTKQAAHFEQYAHELAQWNQHTNLTAIVDPAEVQVRHFLDSLSLAQVIKFEPPMRLIDVGTGAGFPGLPLAIVYPELKVTLLEATGKKVDFLAHMINVLGLDNATAVKARAEEAGHMPEHRAQYDVVVARAVARMPALMEYLLPLAKNGGRCIAMKGTTAEEESKDAQKALKILGGRVFSIDSVQLPQVDDLHYLVTVEKVNPTPSGFPRKPGVPTRKPLD